MPSLVDLGMVASFVDLGIVVVQAVLIGQETDSWRLEIANRRRKRLKSNGIGIRRRYFK